MNGENTKPVRIRLWRQGTGDPALRYDEAARHRLVLRACRRGGPALDVGTGSRASMARSLAHCGMQVTAVDRDTNAVAFAERVAAAPELNGRLKVLLAGGRRLPFDDGSFRVVVAFDCLGHARHPKRILAEMFRVCAPDGLVLIAEYNEKGRRATRHRNFGFEHRLARLLRAHCGCCRRLDQPHHVSYVCDATARHITL